MGGFTIDRSKTVHVPFRGFPGPTNVADRLRECEKADDERVGVKKITPIRRSRFTEVGLDDDTIERVDVGSLGVPAVMGHSLSSRNTWSETPRAMPTSRVPGEKREIDEPRNASRAAKIVKTGRSLLATANTPPTAFSTIPRVALLVFLIAVVVPTFVYSGRLQNNIHIVNGNGADAGVIRGSELVDNGSRIEGRANSPTSVCTRWSHMSIFQPTLRMIDHC